MIRFKYSLVCLDFKLKIVLIYPKTPKSKTPPMRCSHASSNQHRIEAAKVLQKKPHKKSRNAA